MLRLTGLAGVGSKSDNQIHGAWLSGGTKALPILLGHERWRLPPSQDCPDFQQTVSRSCRLELLSARRRRGISDLDRCSSWMVFPSSIKLDVHSIYLPPASGSILQMQHWESTNQSAIFLNRRLSRYLLGGFCEKTRNRSSPLYLE